MQRKRTPKGFPQLTSANEQQTREMRRLAVIEALSALTQTFPVALFERTWLVGSMLLQGMARVEIQEALLLSIEDYMGALTRIAAGDYRFAQLVDVKAAVAAERARKSKATLRWWRAQGGKVARKAA